jgi:N6-L-threonylcarbamoyladenine synthase
LVIAGGVGANQTLRNRMMALGAEHAVDVYFPRLEFCTDNGAMIAYAGWLRLAAGQQQDLAIEARARWPLEDLTPLPAQ